MAVLAHCTWYLLPHLICPTSLAGDLTFLETHPQQH